MLLCIHILIKLGEEFLPAIVDSLPESEGDAVLGIADGFKTEYTSPNTNILCSLTSATSSTTKSFIEATFQTKFGYRTSCILLYQVDPQQYCQHYKDRNLEGAAIHLTQISERFLGSISAEDSVKSIITSWYSVPIKKDFVTVRLTAGLSNQITLCEMKMFGYEEELVERLTFIEVSGSQYDLLPGDNVTYTLKLAESDLRKHRPCFSVDFINHDNSQSIEYTECCFGGYMNYYGVMRVTALDNSCINGTYCRYSAAHGAVGCLVTSSKKWEQCQIFDCTCGKNCTFNQSVRPIPQSSQYGSYFSAYVENLFIGSFILNRRLQCKMNATILSRLRTIEKINYFLLHNVSSFSLERFQHSDFNNSLCLFNSKTMNAIGRISQKD